MKTLFQIGFGVLLGGFILLFCMANDDWVIIRLPRAPWHAEPSFPFFETQIFVLILAGFGAGILSSLFPAYFFRRRRKSRELEKDRKIAALEIELAKANRLLAATAQKPGENTPAKRGAQ
jgi:ABC-type antimicrobial peptide transport system permease subunit